MSGRLAARVSSLARIGVLAGLPSLFWSEPASALPDWPQEAKLLASDGAQYDTLGQSVSLSGNAALVGAPTADGNVQDSGAAYIFRFDGTSWAQEAKLLAADGWYYGSFGDSVALDGAVALVGAYGDDDNGNLSGSAYVFRFDGTNWSQEAKLVPSDGGTEDNFGWSVALDGDVALVGAWADDVNGTNTGSAYVFRFDGTNWTQEAKLLAGDRASYDEFGFSVSVSGDAALVGARTESNSNGGSSGSAYLFRFDGTNWNAETKLIPSDGKANENFGWSVSLSGDVALIGAGMDDDMGSFSGSAYVFRFDGTDWNEEAKLLPSNGGGFGRSVSISEDVALIGALAESSRGSAYIFRYDGTSWGREAVLLASDGATNDLFGESVSLSGDAVLVGAYGNDDRGSESGSAYVFRLDSGGECFGEERIKKASCRDRNGANQVKVSLAGGQPGDPFTVTLTDGSTKSGTINDRGTGKAKFSDRPSGDSGDALAEWGCGASDTKAYTCP